MGLAVGAQRRERPVLAGSRGRPDGDSGVGADCPPRGGFGGGRGGAVDAATAGAVGPP